MEIYMVLGFTALGWISFALLWVFYLAVMHLKKRREHMGTVHKIWVTPVVVIGVVLDIIVNVVFATVWFLDLPKEWLLTARLQRYRATATGRKLRHAVYLCEELLNPFDDGHC